VSTSGEQWSALVEQVAGMPEVIAVMLREHASTAADATSPRSHRKCRDLLDER